MRNLCEINKPAQLCDSLQTDLKEMKLLRLAHKIQLQQRYLQIYSNTN